MMASNQNQSEDRKRTPPAGMVDSPHKIRSVVLTDWDNIRDSLPHPDDVWRWGETSMRHKTLYAFKDANLIVPAQTDKHWQTTEILWEYVQKTALPGEDVGTAVGDG